MPAIKSCAKCGHDKFSHGHRSNLFQAKPLACDLCQCEEFQYRPVVKEKSEQAEPEERE